MIDLRIMSTSFTLLFLSTALRAEGVNTRVLTECTQSVGVDATLLKTSTTLPNIACDSLQAITLSITFEDRRIGFSVRARTQKGNEPAREFIPTSDNDVLDDPSVQVCQVIEKHGDMAKVVNEWSTRKNSHMRSDDACHGRSSDALIYRRYVREIHNGVIVNEHACIVLSHTKVECVPLSAIEDIRGRERAQRSLQIADERIRQQSHKSSKELYSHRLVARN